MVGIISKLDIASYRVQVRANAQHLTQENKHKMCVHFQ